MRRLVLFVVILLTITRVYSQGFEIAVYTEPQFSWIGSDGSEIVNDGSILNLNTGIEFNMYFMESYAFTLGLTMNNSGGNLLYNEDISFGEQGNFLLVNAGSIAKLNLQYITIPLGLKLKSEELGYTSFYFHGGLIPMMKLKANITTESLDHKFNISPNINFFNVNYFAEAGIEFRLAGNTALIAGLKWSAGFTDVTSNDLVNANLNSVGLHLGILF